MSSAPRQELVYNLPGLGNVRTPVFPNTAAVIGFLQAYGHMQRLRTTNQLGVLRKAFPGAHHTRYEYVVAQLSLVGGMASGLVKDFPLSSNRTEFGKLPGIEHPSGADLLQTLSVLTNTGHLPTTFAASRAFLHYVTTHKSVGSAFRRGLPEEDRSTFDDIVGDFKVYRLHYLIMSFLLERYRRREDGTEYARFCQAILREFVRRESDNESLRSLWLLFSGIRRLSFLALDSLYAPVPFSVDFGSVLLGLGREESEMFGARSPFQDALERFTSVMQDSVYLSSNALLHLSLSSEQTLSELASLHDVSPDTVTGLWRILAPGSGASGPSGINEKVFLDSPGRDESDWHENRSVKLNYSMDPRDAGLILKDTVDWERRAQGRVGKQTGRFGAEWSPDYGALRVVGAATGNGESPYKATRGIARQLVKFDMHVRKQTTSYEAGAQISNGELLSEFLTRSVFGWNHLYRLRSPRVIEPSPIVTVQGSTSAAQQISQYRTAAEERDFLSKADGHECDVLERLLRSIEYRGLLLAYAGRTEILDMTTHKEVAEFDGLVFLLSRNPNPGEVLVVEAKNTAQGHTDAKRQLRTQLPKLGFDAASLDLRDIGQAGAYAVLSPG